MIRKILFELKNHAPFTVLGAVTGIILLIPLHKLPTKISYNIFYTLHPLHVLLSALVTASMYNIHRGKSFREKCNLWALLIIGYLGSIGIATLSDSIIPYLGEVLLNMPNREIHIGFIEEFWLVNSLALIGIATAYFRPRTKFPHAGHVLISTWASLFHIIMAKPKTLNLTSSIAIFLFLFIAVWLPCCVSDIVFPLLFVRKSQGLK